MTWFRKGLRCARSMTAARRSRTARSRASSSLRSEFRIKEQAMTTITKGDTIKTITTHYIDGVFVESHGREVMDMIKPTNGQVIARVTLADEEDTRHAIAAAKSAFANFGRPTKEERAKILRRLHEAASARLDDLTAAMVEEYGGVVRVAGRIVESGVDPFLAAGKTLQGIPGTRRCDKTPCNLGPVSVDGLMSA